MSARNLSVPPRVQAKIDAARRRLQQASAVLKCLSVAFNEDAEIDFGDVAITAGDVIDAAVNALDVVELERSRGEATED